MREIFRLRRSQGLLAFSGALVCKDPLLADNQTLTRMVRRGDLRHTGRVKEARLEGARSKVNLRDRGYFHLLQEISSRLAVNASFDKSYEMLSDVFFFLR